MSTSIYEKLRRRIALRRQKKAIEELVPIIKKMKPSQKGFAVKSVREDRDSAH